MKSPLGKFPAKGSTKLLSLNNFVNPALADTVPKATNFWRRRSAFPLRTFGNDVYGDCTRASQALLMMRLERIETKSTPKITDEEVIRVYTDMSNRLYGGGDNGAFEIDALSEWRKPDLTFRDIKGRPLTIDAYTSIDFRDVNAVKSALWLSAAHGIKVCFNLPIAWQASNDVWDIPEGVQPIGNYLPGSWGGHSMTARDYDEKWVYLPSSWALPDGKISWRAFSIYCDEAYMVIDSLDTWRKKQGSLIDIPGLKDAVNSVSSMKIK
jgi:hypothetical protein